MWLTEDVPKPEDEKAVRLHVSVEYNQKLNKWKL